MTKKLLMRNRVLILCVFELKAAGLEVVANVLVTEVSSFLRNGVLSS